MLRKYVSLARSLRVVHWHPRALATAASKTTPLKVRKPRKTQLDDNGTEAETVKGKPGRPRKTVDLLKSVSRYGVSKQTLRAREARCKNGTTTEEATSSKSKTRTAALENPLKRTPGRPRKTADSATEVSDREAIKQFLASRKTEQNNLEDPGKRKRRRPKEVVLDGETLSSHGVTRKTRIRDSTIEEGHARLIARAIQKRQSRQDLRRNEPRHQTSPTGENGKATSTPYPSAAAIPKDPPSVPPSSKPAPSRSPKTSLIPPSNKAQHHDLPTFLAHAARNTLNPTSTVYKGTHYEYTVAATLSHYGFQTQRTGKAGDLGVDLVGSFFLPQDNSPPDPSKEPMFEIKTIVQCKATTPQPSMVRELEGAFIGAPASFRRANNNMLAILVSSGETTKGLRDALQRSRWPMALMQVTEDGDLKQFLWNAVAADVGLEGLGVTVRYKMEIGVVGGRDARVDEVLKKEEGVRRSIALTWMGRVFRVKQ
ncbi:hypothetical protein LTR37_019712 [Vermiconidia calcicola]|uniref:Uncharacterized protein n=1 Tax=Vermiconidia calcicola TaxID=1690605 RepID=A0ACC3MDC2_9PEZI|nr:hypothetical protein LTR37_019712 [Vermiconidia calcicola]